MDKFLFALLLVFFKFAFVHVVSFPWSLFDPLLAIVVIYTFFHSLDMRHYLVYALFCGFLRDVFGLDVFGISMLSYLACAFGVAVASRIIYRQNWVFVFPMVFFGVFLNNQLIFLLRVLLLPASHMNFSGWFFIRSLVESIGTVLLSYPLYIFSKRCVPGLTG